MVDIGSETTNHQAGFNTALDPSAVPWNMISGAITNTLFNNHIWGGFGNWMGRDSGEILFYCNEILSGMNNSITNGRRIVILGGFSNEVHQVWDGGGNHTVSQPHDVLIF